MLWHSDESGREALMVVGGEIQAWHFLFDHLGELSLFSILTTFGLYNNLYLSVAQHCLLFRPTLALELTATIIVRQGCYAVSEQPPSGSVLLFLSSVLVMVHVL
jgi:hypothetical protein